MSTHEADELRTEEEAAAVLRKPIGTLQQWRHRRVGPAYVKMGRAVRYRQSDLDAYIESNVIRPRSA